MADQQSISFEADIRPLFREVDIEHMRPMDVLLDDYQYMSQRANAELVHDFLSGKKQPQMPPDDPWSVEQVELFARWMQAGCPK